MDTDTHTDTIVEDSDHDYTAHILGPCLAIVASACIIIIVAFIISRMRRRSGTEGQQEAGDTSSIGGTSQANTQQIYTIPDPIQFKPLPETFVYKPPTESNSTPRLFDCFSKPKRYDPATHSKVTEQLKDIYVY